MVFETAITAPVFGLRREMNRLLDDMLTRGPNDGMTQWAPPVDIREDQSAITISVELPGIPPEQVEVTTENGMLTVRGEKRLERKEGDEQRYHLVERSYGSFTRTFQLPKGVDDSKIEAEFNNGLLHIRVPKAALPQPRKIAIAGAQGKGGTNGGANGGTTADANTSTGKQAVTS
jgi:HSP20 family protein